MVTQILHLTSRNHKHYFVAIMFILAFLNSTLTKSQDLNVDQTLDYLNKKFNEFPYDNQDGIFRYMFAITETGELKIEEKYFMRNIFKQGEFSDPAIKIFKISVDKIDLMESFEKFVFNAKNVCIYPTWDGSYSVESLDYLNIPGYKKSVAATSNSFSRNYILILLGDVSQLNRINNALHHLCTLIISDPIKYSLAKEQDPFEKGIQSKNTELISGELTNSIKIIKTESGLIEVPIVLNDVLKINFIFDSGASEVSLSPDVALTLIRTGTITEKDWLPSQNYIFADGSTAKSKRFLIKKLIIGNQILTNIEASISNSVEAPMLVGQNVMSKLGAITIDYENQLLIIKSR